MNGRTGIVIGVIAVVVSVAAVLTFTASPDGVRAQANCPNTLNQYATNFDICMREALNSRFSGLDVSTDSDERTVTVSVRGGSSLERHSRFRGWRVESVSFRLQSRARGGGQTSTQTGTARPETPYVFRDIPLPATGGTVDYFVEARLEPVSSSAGNRGVNFHLSGKGSVSYTIQPRPTPTPTPTATPRPTRVPDTDIVYAEVTKGGYREGGGQFGNRREYDFVWRTTGQQPNWHSVGYSKLDSRCKRISDSTFERYNGHATAHTLLLKEPENGLPNNQSWKFSIEAGSASVFLYSRSACGLSRIGHPLATEVQTGVPSIFSKVPVAHGGNNFTFTLRFSAEPESDFSYVNMRDDVLNVTGGVVVSASRLDRSSNRGWLIYIDPVGNPDVVVTLPTTTDCNLASAVCDDQGVPLGDTGTITVPRDD